MKSRFTKNFFNRPTSILTCGKRTSFQSKECRPLRNGHCFVSEGDVVISPRIVRLAPWRVPSYVSRTVRKIVVNTVNRMPRRGFWSNMREKSWKRCNPFSANGYASSSIIFITFAVRISASLYHARPSSIFRDIAFPMGKARESIRTEASTAFSVSPPKVGATTYNSVSADAAAFPSCASILAIGDTASNGKPHKCLSGEVDEVLGVHDVTSWLKVVVERVCWKAVNQFPLFGSYPIQHGTY